jgi:type II secretory pathway component PulJ
MKLPFKKIAGFTLIELTIYIAILSVITVMVADSFLILNKGKGGVAAKSELNSNLRFVLERMKRDVSSASSLITPNTTAATSSSLVLVVGANSISYIIDNNRIARQVDSQPLEYVSSDRVRITDMYFSRLENTNLVLDKKRISVEINVFASYNSNSPDWQYSQNERTSIDLNQDF